MTTEFEKKYASAVFQLSGFCNVHRKEKETNLFHAYMPICSSGIFDDTETAKLLLTANDEAYDYIINEIRSDEKVLLNIFSGSGRLIHELSRYHLLERFEIIYNLDSSKQMIAFEKQRFHHKNMKYICSDILNMGSADLNYDLAVCHCGIRYINPSSYLKLLNILFALKHSHESRCIVTEVDEKFTEALKTLLAQNNVNFKHIKKKVKMHRNTTLYLSLLYYKSNPDFQTLIDELSSMQHKNFGDILREISGYKIADLNILIF